MDEGTSSGKSNYELPFFVDTAEDEKSYYLWADLPGVDKQDLRITTKEQTITITANRMRPGAFQSTNNEKDASSVEEEEQPAALRPRRRERPFGAFRRQLTFPEDADLDGVTAKVTAGVLQLVIPKRTVHQPEWREVTVA